MLDIILSSQFKRDLRNAKKRGYDLTLLNTVVDLIAQQLPLEEKYRDHALRGNFVGFRECHIQPDWLLIYRIDRDALFLLLSRTGTHSELF